MRNRTVRIIASGAVILQLAMPAVGAAQNGEPAGDGNLKQPRGQVQANIAGRVCDALEQQADRIVGRHGQQKARLEEKRGNRSGVLAEHRERQENRWTDIREGFDERHEARIALLLEKVGDDEAKQAILEFQQALKDALSVRRTAFDAALSDYHAAVDAAIAARRAAIDTAASDLEAAIDAAVATAEAACDVEDVDLPALRDELRAQLQAAREQFRTDMQAVAPVNDTIKGLVDERQAAFDAAREQFRISVEAAKAELKAKLNELRPADDTAN